VMGDKSDIPDHALHASHFLAPPMDLSQLSLLSHHSWSRAPPSHCRCQSIRVSSVTAVGTPYTRVHTAFELLATAASNPAKFTAVLVQEAVEACELC
jgi:hypothetical protein